jgi:hypothetical protein
MRQLLGRVRGLPGGHQSNWRYFEEARVRTIKVTAQWAGPTPIEGNLELGLPFGQGTYIADELEIDDLPDPILDAFGQLNGETWEGKILGSADLATDGWRDLESLNRVNPIERPSRFGGWADGPRLEATGRFRVDKIDGKWWFVDPDGLLFWSTGATGVGQGSETPFLGERYYQKETGEAWETGATARGYEFYRSNLFRKYGREWETAHSRVTANRMWEWGVNTIGAWSSDLVIATRQVPYTLIISSSPQGLGKLHKVPDPFCESFRENLRGKVAALAHDHAGDPWNLGIFIDNELNWGQGSRLAAEVLELENTVPAKAALLGTLRERYSTVKDLNAAWGTAYETFASVGHPTPSTRSAAFMEDMQRYTDLHADTYFRLCKEALHAYFPGHLYLGSRFHGSIYDGRNRVVQQAASRHVDVMSYNIYKASVGEAILDQEVDRLILIGEFHFGTGSHGVWGYGLVPASSLEHQASLYTAYVQEAATDPRIIGAHWFRWVDHPVTGRFDGENYRIGIVSVADRPYAPLIQAIRQVSDSLYPTRYAR